VKLFWVTTWRNDPKPEKLYLCVTNPEAVRHLRNSWQGQAIKSLGVEIVPVTIPADLTAQIKVAESDQGKDFRKGGE